MCVIFLFPASLYIFLLLASLKGKLTNVRPVPQCVLDFSTTWRNTSRDSMPLIWVQRNQSNKFLVPIETEQTTKPQALLCCDTVLLWSYKLKIHGISFLFIGYHLLSTASKRFPLCFTAAAVLYMRLQRSALWKAHVKHVLYLQVPPSTELSAVVHTCFSKMTALQIRNTLAPTGHW